MNLRHLADKTLLQDTKMLVSQERDLSVAILHHLKEIEKRRLFSDLGYGSLFEYTVRELGYSEPAANRRINAARLLKNTPQIEEKIADGSLSLTNLALAAQLFRNEQINDPKEQLGILKSIENATKRECEAELRKFMPNDPPPRESERKHSDNLHVVKFNLSDDTIGLLKDVKDTLAHNRLSNDEILNRTFKIALPIFQNRKFKTNAKLTTLAASPSDKRYISNIIKKEVYERDGGKCTKCKTSYKLEFDHIKPFAEGGNSTKENLRLLCFSCNQRRLHAR